MEYFIVYQHTTFLVKQASQFVNLSVYQSDLDKKTEENNYSTKPQELILEKKY